MPLIKKPALVFVLLIGIVSLFSDITYQGARGILGPYLTLLGAGAAVIGVVSGFSEFLGYTLRFFSGKLSDKLKSYWTLMLIGYGINLLAVPLIAFVPSLPWAISLIVLERIGKAIRTPSRDAMLASATKEIGRGFGFGLHEAMDRIGALSGPLIVAAVISASGSYKLAFASLLIPAFIALSILGSSRFLYPDPRELEKEDQPVKSGKLPRAFWVYLFGAAFIAAGFVDFPLIAFHMIKKHSFSDVSIPLFYALAMAVDALSALFFGKLYDKIGMKSLIAALLISFFFAPMIFLMPKNLIIWGVVVWGVGLGAQESLIKAIVADLVPKNIRATAYGIFNGAFGISWFLGSALIGLLYQRSLIAISVISLVLQLSALPFLFLLISNSRTAAKN